MDRERAIENPEPRLVGSEICNSFDMSSQDYANYLYLLLKFLIFLFRPFLVSFSWLMSLSAAMISFK